MQLNFLTGGGAKDPVLDLTRDGLLNAADRVGTGTGVTSVPIGVQMGAGVFSQPVRISTSANFSTLFSRNDDLEILAPKADRGVSGGHFDADIYYGGAGAPIGGSSNRHVHEYDDKYDVTGVSMLSASDAGLNLSNAITSTTTGFKVLIANQKLNPAAGLRIGPTPAGEPEYAKVWTLQTTADLDITTLPTYTRADISKLKMNLPLDAFASKEWWTGSGDIRVGLLPTVTGCVHAGDPHPLGAIYNGALTIQIVAAATTNADIELNVAGQPAYGYRLKAASRGTRRLAEYTYFWHHPNGKCASAAGWTQTPPQDNDASTAKPVAKAAGSNDPTDGSFTNVDGGPTGTGGTVTNVTVTKVNNVTTTVVTYADGTVVTEKRTEYADGRISIQINGGVIRWYQDDIVYGDPDPVKIAGRAAWRELIKR
jgi:hypothetical protein